MRTRHRLLITDARRAEGVAPESVDLVVTSPPYPMIEMWDAALGGMNPEITRTLEADQGFAAFEAMHRELDQVWSRVASALRPGGFACVNIGDATRSLGGEFAFYPNHARALAGLRAAGLTPLPDILWRKPTNAPNKFMGSGMLPAGAYVTYEHEYVLIARKGGKRSFNDDARALRRRSAYFWEERNLWFSDLWEGLPGTPQRLPGVASRKRSAAFPFELPFRLICMYSMQGDTVWDPFAGTGTTLLAAAVAGRNSVGCELDRELKVVVDETLKAAQKVGLYRVRQRLGEHRRFVADRIAIGKVLKHHNPLYRFPVMTKQETDLLLPWVVGVRARRDGWVVEHLLDPKDPGGDDDGPQLSLLGA
ncbi:MAG: site-specific DNA-methyltransferase [Alphaproteobacteria bacterium]|nr:site-specific DNA-methyltransferase [Alphaproteobacteria bacterium]